MRKKYITPNLVNIVIGTHHTLLAASGEVMPTTIIDDETADGKESLSRLNWDDWDDEEEEENF